MTQEQQTVLLIKGLISELPEDQRQICNELVSRIRLFCESAGEPVGSLALALIGAEKQMELNNQ